MTKKKTCIRLLAILLAVLMLSSNIGILGSAADIVEVTEGSCTYRIADGKATLYSCVETAAGKIEISSTVMGNSVSKIDDYAFYGCTLVTGVTIPSTVKAIGKYAFAFCTSLKSVEIPASVTSIGDNAFQRSNNVTISCEAGSYADSYARSNGISTEIVSNIYNLREETYSFDNFRGIYIDRFGNVYPSECFVPDCYNGGHCFGMSSTSSGYYIGTLNKSIVGENNSKSTYSLSFSEAVVLPIHHYQEIQGSTARSSMVAGGTAYKSSWDSSIGDYSEYDMNKDWAEVINYVKNHQFDGKGNLQIGIRDQGEGGHAINFLRYEKVGGQERIYAYDNNFPEDETYFYKASDGNVYQTPKATFGNGATIDCITLRSMNKYFSIADEYDSTHVVFANVDEISVEGATEYPLECSSGKDQSFVYEIPETANQVKIKPLVDYAEFRYMDQTYSFGSINDDTVGTLTLKKDNVDGTSVEPELTINNSKKNTRINIDNINLYYKSTATLKPRITTDEGLSYAVKYESSNPKVATVDKDGNVNALKKGNATITVTVTDQYGNVVKDTCTVTVKYTWWQWFIVILFLGWLWY